MRRLLRALVPVVALLVSTIGQPAITAAADPHASPAPQVQADGSVLLPNGKVLPVAPPGLVGPSEMATEWMAHQHDKLSFTPGSRPQPRTDATLSVAPSSTDQAGLIPLAPTTPTATQATLAASTALPNGLKKEVFGFLPYWMLSATDLQWLRYDNLSTIAYFGVAARSDGSLTTSGSTWGGWTSSAMTSVTNAAHARGDRVVLTITMMAWDSASATAQATLLNSATNRARLISNIAATVKARNADGVNLDFEPLGSSLRSQYTQFVKDLKKGLAAAGAGSYLTVCTTAGAATWATGYDVTGLTASGAADAIFVMGYDYSWSGSSRAGGVAPMSSPYMLDVNQSVNDFLSLTSGSRLIWGVPYYGRTWHTTTSALNAPTVSGAGSSAWYYTGALSKAQQYGRKWDAVGQVPWFVYYDSTAGNYVEGYYDDTTSLAVKYDMINSRGMAGVGIWHLLMDQDASALWNLLLNKFQKDVMAPSGGVTVLPETTDEASIPVSWRAFDPGSGVASYTVQVRDRASSTWTTWLSGITGTSALFSGTPGHTYEFRVAAKDKLGNVQPWVAPMSDPGGSLAVGRFARVAVATLNVRYGAGTGFSQITQLSQGDRVALLAGPISSGGYTWYQVQFAFGEWPSADYPRTGWVASGDASSAYLVPAVAPTVTTLAPAIRNYAVSTRIFSPNGDGAADTVSATYSLATTASSVRLDVLNAAGSAVASTSLGSQGAGNHAVTWNGRVTGGAWASGGVYLLRITAVDAAGTHVTPVAIGDAAAMAAWGVTADLTPPGIHASDPHGTAVDRQTDVTAVFTEPVSPVNGTTFRLLDTTLGKAVPATVSYDPGTLTATLRPTQALASGHAFSAQVNGVRDAASNPMNASWSFTAASGLPFTDLAGSSFLDDIAWLYDTKITSGCSATTFCPGDSITRGQMAAFLDRALDLPSTPTDYFSDDNASPYEASINRVAAAGITAGCGAGKFCPNAPVLRDQMASFLVRAFAVPRSSHDYFSDDAGNSHEGDINAIAAAGITTGCSPTTYCPSLAVTREQMAAFLHRAMR